MHSRHTTHKRTHAHTHTHAFVTTKQALDSHSHTHTVSRSHSLHSLTLSSALSFFLLFDPFVTN